jgi:hypothetical protein
MYKAIKYKMRTLQIKYIVVSRENMRQYFIEKVISTIQDMAKRSCSQDYF